MEKNTYLYDESKSPDGMVSVSQLQTFLSCRKKWEYNYIDGLKPRVERSYLSIGKLCHVGMQNAMHEMWKDQIAGLDTSFGGGLFQSWLLKGLQAMENKYISYCTETPHLEEEIPEFEQLWKDSESIFRQAFLEFQPWRYEIETVCKDGEYIPTLELHFKVPCKYTKGLHGYIDAILKDRETGFVWCTDYKFRKSLSPDEEEAFNIQNAVYAYACMMLGIPITGTMTWQHLNTPASDPSILKNGQPSRAKIKTTINHYISFCADHGIEVDDDLINEMQEKLSDIEWFRATYEYRNVETVNRIWKQCVEPVAEQVTMARENGAVNFRSLYPWNCKMCQYQSLCQAELRNYDVSAIRDREYVKRLGTNGIDGEATESALSPAT